MNNEALVVDYIKGLPVDETSLKSAMYNVLRELEYTRAAIRPNTINKNRYSGQLVMKDSSEKLCSCGELVSIETTKKIPWNVLSSFLKHINRTISEDMT